MPEMTWVERTLCQSAPWRALSRRLVLAWALQSVKPYGKALEIGGGSGAMASGMLREFPELHLTVTDFDPKMLEQAGRLLAPFGEEGIGAARGRNLVAASR